MGPTQSVIVGVVSGLITGSLLFLLSQLFRKAFLPWYREFIYDGILIGGTWYVQSTDPPHHRDITIELTQHAFILTGISTHVAKSSEVPGDRIRTYKLQGKIHNRFLSLTGTPTDSKRLGALHYLLELKGDGQTMVGYCTAYSTVQDKIIGANCKLSRREDVSSAMSQDAA